MTKRPPRFFHGSYADLEPGAELKPGSVLGRQNWPDKENHAVFMVRTAKGAVTWAGNAAKNAGKDRAHVYEVEPVGEPEKRRTPWEGDEYLAPAARVVRRVSSHVVLNPGREEGIFGDRPAQLAPVPKVVKQHVEGQVKGQRSLFPAKDVVSTPRDHAVRKAENERFEPAPTLPARPAHTPRDNPEEWANYDVAHAQHRAYQGLPPAAAPPGLFRDRR